MWFLYIKEDVGYEEFLAAVYEAETEGSEGKVVNVKTEVLTVEKMVENREQNKLKDLRQQIESLATIMKSATVGSTKPKVMGGVSLPRKKESAWYLSSEIVSEITQKGEGTFETRAKAYQMLCV